MHNSLSGIITPLITPLDDNYNVCKRSVRTLISHVDDYTSAYMPTLTSGEGWGLIEKQWSAMVECTLKYSSKKKVLVGVEFPTTKKVISYGKIAKAMGADCIVVTTPFQRGLTQQDIYKHFCDVLTFVDMPIFIYNEESISRNHIELKTMIQICDLEGVVGVKEACGDVEFTNKLIENVDLPIFQGWENLALSTNNPAGYIFPLSNINPELCLKMLKEPTKQFQDEIDELCLQYEIMDSSPHINLKKVLHQMSIIKTANIV